MGLWKLVSMAPELLWSLICYLLNDLSANPEHLMDPKIVGALILAIVAYKVFSSYAAGDKEVQLMALQRSQLVKRAREAGVDELDIDECMDNPNPQKALVQLIMSREEAGTKSSPNSNVVLPNESKTVSNSNANALLQYQAFGGTRDEYDIIEDANYDWELHEKEWEYGLCSCDREDASYCWLAHCCLCIFTFRLVQTLAPFYCCCCTVAEGCCARTVGVLTSVFSFLWAIYTIYGLLEHPNLGLIIVFGFFYPIVAACVVSSSHVFLYFAGKTHFGIKENCCLSFLKGWFCVPCSMIQLHKQADSENSLDAEISDEQADEQ